MNARTAVRYAATVIKGPWPEAEHIILQDPVEAEWYAVNILKRRWPELEPKLIRLTSTRDVLYHYCWTFGLKSNWTRSGALVRDHSVSREMVELHIPLQVPRDWQYNAWEAR
jgi:hypothetical protein